MISNKTLFIFFVACIAMCGSFPLMAQKVSKVDSSSMLTIRLDPQSARGAKVSQLFDEVKFIPLETTKESLFGNIYDLKTVKDRFVVFDYDTKAALIFSKEGKFKGKIDASKIPKDENDKSKSDLFGYKIVADGKDSVISIYSSKYYFYFDLNGKLLKKVAHQKAEDYNEYKLADGLTTVRQRYKKTGKDSTLYDFAVIRDKDTVGYFPYTLKRFVGEQHWDYPKFFESGLDGGLHFVNMYGYNIYRIAPSKVSLVYRVIFPANNSLPQDFLTNPEYVGKRREYFQKNQKVFFSMNNTYQIGDYLYLQTRSYSFDRDTKKALVYNLKTTELLSLQDLEPDSLSSFLPITDAGAYYDFLSRGFLLYKDEYLYTSYSSLAMFAFKEQMGDRTKKFPPLLEEYFKTQDRKSNPVIIQLKPKKH